MSHCNQYFDDSRAGLSANLRITSQYKIIMKGKYDLNPIKGLQQRSFNRLLFTNEFIYFPQQLNLINNRQFKQ